MTDRARFVGSLAVALAAVALTSCTPITNSEHACPTGNLALTAQKDADSVGRFHSGIDPEMEELLSASGFPSCAIAVVAENRIATINWLIEELGLKQ